MQLLVTQIITKDKYYLLVHLHLDFFISKSIPYIHYYSFIINFRKINKKIKISRNDAMFRAILILKYIGVCNG